MDHSPIKLTPTIKDYIWGGTKLITEFNKKTGLEKAAESFRCLTVLEGSGTLESDGSSMSISKGESIFIPAHDGKIVLNGETDAVLSYV